MTSQQDTAASTAQGTGTPDATYHLVSVLYHALQGADTSRRSIQDAEQTGNEELVQFFQAAQAWQQHLATQAQEMLTRYLDHGEGQQWNPEMKIWNLTIMA
jgi:hypothetical protein